jgi:phosphoribosyl 1,2-cyclic phosphate phosphodiesterase
LKGSSVLVVNALRKEKHISHFSLDEALELIAELGPEKAYLTHLSHQMGKHADIEQQLPEGVFLAYDGLRLEI